MVRAQRRNISTNKMCRIVKRMMRLAKKWRMKIGKEIFEVIFKRQVRRATDGENMKQVYAMGVLGKVLT